MTVTERQERVWRLVQMYAADPSRPRSVRELVRITGVSERTLQLLSHKFTAQPIMTYVRRRRMELAHAMLLRADPTTTTVTTVAIHCGFAELGRFAINYRQLFGQSPSMTLRFAGDLLNGSL